eukprot:716761-Hanusia_phi.AAC.1
MKPRSCQGKVGSCQSRQRYLPVPSDFPFLNSPFNLFPLAAINNPVPDVGDGRGDSSISHPRQQPRHRRSFLSSNHFASNPSSS